MTASPRENEHLVQRWRTFWFKPESTSVLGVVRIAFGFLMVAWTLSLLPNLTRLFGEGSVMPRPPNAGYEWGLFDLSSGAGLRITVWASLLVASIALMVGWRSRLAALLVFVGVMTFERGNPFTFNSGDALIRLEALFLVLAPCGAAYSLDRRRAVGSFWSAQVRAPWVIRLMQVQVTVIYVFAVLDKLQGHTWTEGTAVSYALQMTDIGNFSIPHAITSNALLMNVATWVTLSLELAIGVLVWKPRARAKVLAAGVALHAALVLTFGIAFFSFAIFVLYLAFLPPERVRAWIANRYATDDTQPNKGTPAAGSPPCSGGRRVRPHHHLVSPRT